MRTSTLLRRNLIYYWRTNLAVVAGVAVAVAVLAGALLVGDSVRASLRDLVLARLGRADLVVASTAFFRDSLADEIGRHAGFAEPFRDAAPLIVFEGVVTGERGKRRASNVQVYGVDERFWRFHGVAGDRSLANNQAFISEGLAAELGLAAGEAVLLTLEKPSAIPSESLAGKKAGLGRTLRLSVRQALGGAALGEFSLRPQQGAARAIFVSLARLQTDLEQAGRANTILIAEREAADGRPAAAQALEAIVRETATLEDLGLRVRALDGARGLALESDSQIISDALADTARAAADRAGMQSAGVFSYLANTIRAGGREIPYSLVTALDLDAFARQSGVAPIVDEEGGAPPILLNDWAAEDLGARPGDEVTLDYYLWHEGGRLETRSAQFRLAGVVPVAAADRDLVPEYPGITESESVSDWDPPFPVDLNRVRPKDEDYWDRYRTTPKAFIPLEAGERLWQSRFGKLTSLRVAVPAGSDLQAALAAYRESLREAVDPLQAGLTVIAARQEGVAASRGATDFGEYFTYFSFFLVVSALMLAALFFKLGVEQRAREVGLLRAVGFPPSRIRNLYLFEGAALSVAGSLLGVAGAIGYGALMMYGLRTWWVEAVGTTLLRLHVGPASLAAGAAGGVFAALLCVAWTLRRLGKASPRRLLAGSLEPSPASPEAAGGATRAKRTTRAVGGRAAALLFGALGLLVLGLATFGVIGQAAGFFGAGVLLLVALLCGQAALFSSGRRSLIHGSGWWPVSRMGFRNVTYRPGRSVLCIALVASATFIIVAVDAFRRDGAAPTDAKSGTGGYALLAESSVPIVPDPNSPEGREDLNLADAEGLKLDELHIERFRLRPGEDASCLNLYRPREPRILAPRADFVSGGRFAFQSSLAESEAERANPWLLLDREPADGAIPVIADANSLAYVLHLGLGEDFVLQAGARPVRLRVVGALADSIFQSELLMSERNFTRLFPEQEGYRFFLIEAPAGRVERAATALEEQLSDYGFDVGTTAERLASFHRVENTYISTFQTLGGLGLLLGTMGLAAVLLRNVLERRRELALLRAFGYNPSHFTLMVVAENALLLACGVLTGLLCALLAIAPALVARGGRLPVLSLGVLLPVVLIVGMTASLLATRAANRSQLLAALRSE